MTKTAKTTNGITTEIPSEIIIGPFRYKVSLIESDGLILEEDKDQVEKPTYLLGKTSSHKQLIEITEDMPYEVERETLMHEILHAVYSCTGGQDDDAPYVGEEKMIQMLSPAIVDVFDRNPKLVSYMFGGK